MKLNPSLAPSSPSPLGLLPSSVLCSHAVHQPSWTTYAVSSALQTYHADVLSSLGIVFLATLLWQNPNFPSMPHLSVSDFKEPSGNLSPSQTHMTASSSKHLKICAVPLSTSAHALYWSLIDFSSIQGTSLQQLELFVYEEMSGLSRQGLVLTEVCVRLR